MTDIDLLPPNVVGPMFALDIARKRLAGAKTKDEAKSALHSLTLAAKQLVQEAE